MTGLGVIFVAALIWAAVRASRRRSAPPQTRGAPPAPTPLGRESGGSAAAGWLLGHELAHGHTDFPGDPLPGGHLGSPSDLAFWGGVMGDDEEEDEWDDE